MIKHSTLFWGMEFCIPAGSQTFEICTSEFLGNAFSSQFMQVHVFYEHSNIETVRHVLDAMGSERQLAISWNLPGSKMKVSSISMKIFSASELDLFNF